MNNGDDANTNLSLIESRDSNKLQTSNLRESITKEGLSPENIPETPEEASLESEDEDEDEDYLEECVGKRIIKQVYSLRSSGHVLFTKITHVSLNSGHPRTVGDSCRSLAQDLKSPVIDPVSNVVKTETKDYRAQSRNERATMEITDKYEPATSVVPNSEVCVEEAQCSSSLWIQEWNDTEQQEEHDDNDNEECLPNEMGLHSVGNVGGLVDRTEVLIGYKIRPRVEYPTMSLFSCRIPPIYHCVVRY